MAFKNIIEKLKDAKNIVSEPTEYDDLDTSGYSPTQQMGAQGLTKTLRAVGAMTPDPVEIETPDGKKILFDPTMMGGLKTVGNLAQLAKMKTPLQANEAIQDIASQYSKSKGLSSERMPAVKVDETRAKLLADAFDKMEHRPNDPEVKKAYDALIRETKDQYQTIKKTGFNPIKITPEMGNPYPGGSKDLIEDISTRNQMKYYPSESGFGSGDKFPDNPMLQKSGEIINGEDVPNNDLFRIVHDYFGHAKEGHSFGPMGEENAFLQHAGMFSPEARRALTTETRGQNSWVNYGPKGEANRLNPANTAYADQKIGLLPEWASDIPKITENNDELLRKILGTETSVKRFPQLNQSLNKKDED